MPSPIAHAVTGYVITSLWSHTLLRKKKLRWLPFYGTSIAVMADLDFIPQIITGDRYHHGLTHSITFAVAVALIAGTVAKYFCRYLRADQLGLLTLAIYGSHLALDLITKGSSGIQLLWPFSTKYYQSSVEIFPSTHWSEPLFQHSGHFIFLAFELSYALLIVAVLWLFKKKEKFGG